MLIQIIMLQRIRPWQRAGGQRHQPTRPLVSLALPILVHLFATAQTALIITTAARTLASPVALTLVGHDPDFMAALAELINSEGTVPVASLTLYFIYHSPAALANGCARRARRLDLGAGELITETVAPVALCAATSIALMCALGIAASTWPELTESATWATAIGLAFVDMEISIWAAQWWDGPDDGGIAATIRRAGGTVLKTATRTSRSMKPAQPRPTTG